MMKMLQRICSGFLVPLMLFSTDLVHAQPFSSCGPDSPAYITYGAADGSGTGLYSYSPVTGSMTTIKAPLITTGTNTRIDAIGYNRVDNYLWGHVSGTNQIARIGSDGSATTYIVTGLPVNTYTLGDVSPTGFMYLAVAGAGSVIYRIDLNAPVGNYSAVVSAASSNTNLLLDWAMNPVDGLLYATASSNIFRYDPASGAFTNLGAINLGDNSVRQLYFDNAGNLYLTGNEATYRITSIAGGNFTPTIYAKNSATIQTTGSDAARCTDASLPAIAPQPAFTCSAGSPAYLVKVSSGSSTLYAYNPMTGTDAPVKASPVLPAGVAGRRIAALGYNTVDNYLWGAIYGTNSIARIGSDGSAQTFVVSGLPVGNYALGDISASGVMYLSHLGTPVTLYSINLASGPPYNATTLFQTNTNIIYDWALNPIDGLLYGVDSRDGRLYTYNPAAAGVTLVGQTGLALNAVTYNPFFDNDGNLYFAGPNGTYRIDDVSPTSFTAYQYSNGTIANAGTSDDIASCRPDLPNPPIAQDDSVTTLSSTGVTINILGNDAADAAYAGASIDPSKVVIVNQPAHGTVSVNPTTGAVTFTPTPAYQGTDTFTYRVKDNNGVLSNVVTVKITIDQKAFDCNSAGIILGNGSLWSFDIITGVWTEVQSEVGNPNGVGYNPKDNFVWGSLDNNLISRVGMDGSVKQYSVPGFVQSFQGDVSPEGKYYSTYSNAGVITFQIVDLDPASPTYLARTNLPITGQVPTGITGGGDFSFSPIDGKIYNVGRDKVLYRVDPVTGVSVRIGTVGPLTLNETYSTFMDNGGNFFVLGGDGKSFRIATPDKLAAPTAGNLPATLISNGVPTGYGDGARCSFAALSPIAAADTLNIQCDNLSINIRANDTPGTTPIVADSTFLIDPLNGALVTSVTISGQGTFSLDQATGEVSFAPVAGFFGTSEVSYHIADQNGLYAEAKITANIVECEPPIARDDNGNTTCNEIVVAVLSNDTAGSAPLVPSSVRILTPGTNSRVTTLDIPEIGEYVVDTTSGAIRFTPINGLRDTVSIDYIVQDENGLEDTATVTIIVDCPMPVTLLSFDARRESSTIQLIWATTEETNSDRFEIERSVNGKVWSKIGIVRSHGESSVRREYEFADPQPEQGENLYRLKMVDKDATFAYSRVRSIQFGDGLIASVYPNPASRSIFLKNADQIKAVEIIDLNGSIVLHSAALKNGEIQVSSLAPGAHIVKVTWTNGSQTSEKILIVK